jgi:Spy/CpxP family protein refolding chaperone
MSLAKVAVFALAIVVLATSVSEAQRRKQQRGQRGQRGFGGGGGGFGNPLAILENETLQKELGLTAAQKKRVKELSLQMQGTAALTSDAVAKELGISDSQKTKITEVRTKSREKFRGLFGGQGGERPNFDEIRKKMDEIRTGVDKEVLAVLTSSQKTKWQSMLGKPADVSKLRPQFGGRRGGGNRPGRTRPKSDI